MAAVTLLFVFFFLNKGNAAFKSLQRGRDMLLNLLIFLWDFSPDSTYLNVCTVIDCSELLIILKWITHFQSLYKNTCVFPIVVGECRTVFSLSPTEVWFYRTSPSSTLATRTYCPMEASTLPRGGSSLTF